MNQRDLRVVYFENYVVFVGVDCVKTDGLVDRRQHLWQRNIRDQMLSRTFDSANRFVADTLEAEWNNKLRLLNEAQEQYERMRQQNHLTIDEAQRTRIAELANDLPRLWQHPQTPDRERKRMIRLLLEDVTLIKRDQISVHVRFKGGVVKTLSISGISESRQVSPQSWNRGSNLRSVRRGAPRSASATARSLNR